mgnify:CR=1 FL=1
METKEVKAERRGREGIHKGGIDNGGHRQPGTTGIPRLHPMPPSASLLITAMPAPSPFAPLLLSPSLSSLLAPLANPTCTTQN